MAIKAIRYTAMLDYCDGPLLFEALDATGGQYLAMLVETDDKRDMYAVIDLAPERLRQFRTGSVDLRTVLVEAEQWYLTETTALDEPLNLDLQSNALADSGFLPKEGFFLQENRTPEPEMDMA